MFSAPGSKKAQVTGDFDRFLELVERLPSGIQIGWLNTCCAGVSYGMGAERQAQLRRAVARRHRTLLTGWDMGHYLCVCTCESTAMRFPGDPPFKDELASEVRSSAPPN